jgi:hypothetical protein
MVLWYEALARISAARRMKDNGLLGPWVRRFLLEHLIGERNLARNTQRSYRDTLRLLLPFAARRARKAIDRLTVEDLSASRVLAFLQQVAPPSDGGELAEDLLNVAGGRRDNDPGARLKHTCTQ